MPGPAAMSIGAYPGPLDYAVQALQAHVPYQWGGQTPSGFDCSGLVKWAFAQAGITVGRTTSDQYAQGETIPLGPAGNRLAYAQPGDVVFFGMNNASSAAQHEGIIVSTAGQGVMVHAPHSGTFVQYGTVGDGDPSEPISGIRRFSSAAALGAALTNPAGGTVTIASHGGPGGSVPGPGDAAGAQLAAASSAEFTSGLVHLFELAAGVILVGLGAWMVLRDMGANPGRLLSGPQRPRGSRGAVTPDDDDLRALDERVRASGPRRNPRRPPVRSHPGPGRTRVRASAPPTPAVDADGQPF